jgi:hypothetical protein
MLENIVYVGVSFAVVFLSLEAAGHFTAYRIDDKFIKQCFYKQVGLVRQKGVPRIDGNYRKKWKNQYVD